jgi:hypothetical protein
MARYGEPLPTAHLQFSPIFAATGMQAKTQPADLDGPNRAFARLCRFPDSAAVRVTWARLDFTNSGLFASFAKGLVATSRKR